MAYSICNLWGDPIKIVDTIEEVLDFLGPDAGGHDVRGMLAEQGVAVVSCLKVMEGGPDVTAPEPNRQAER